MHSARYALSASTEVANGWQYAEQLQRVVNGVCTLADVTQPGCPTYYRAGRLGGYKASAPNAAAGTACVCTVTE